MSPPSSRSRISQEAGKTQSIGRRRSQARNHHGASSKQNYLLHGGFSLRLFLDPAGPHAPLKSLLIFNGLHGVIFQKTELFITTAVSTSYPTNDRNV
jgi:hypothetical protein